jgi:hypothetical protein
MIDWLVNRLFWWTRLREAITYEVHMYDMLDKIMKDPDSMKIGSTYYTDLDGTRGWSFSEETNKYYFNDVPEDSLTDAFFELEKMEKND